jgi:N-acetylmuramoyl-L-alanine amidase
VLVCLDYGHGGSDPGAIGPAGTKEADLVLTVGKRCKETLEAAGVDVCESREGREFVSLGARALASNSYGADLFLSIHANSAASPVAAGFEAFTSPGPTEADHFATALLQTFAGRWPDRTFRRDVRDGDPDKEARFTVLTATRAPAVLFELGFVSNPSEEQWMLRNRIGLGDTLAEGVLTYVGRDAPTNSGPYDPTGDLLSLSNDLDRILRRLGA